MWPTKTSVSHESAFQVKHDKRKKEKSKFKSFSATTVLLCIFVLSYSVIPSITGAYFARFLADLFDKLMHNKFTHRYIVFFIVVFLCHNCSPVLFTRRVVKNFTLFISSGAWMFRRTFNVHVSQNLFSTRFWATLNLMETFWTHLFSNPPPSPRKKMFCLPMSSLPPSFMRYQNISPLIKPHAWILKYIFISAVSECNRYKILNDSDRLSNLGRSKKCDKNLTEDWYRFSAWAGTNMPTHCLPYHRCSTDLPGWMDGAHPTVDEGVVSRKVCFSGFGNCCYRNIIINVRNCSSFFVYRLKPVSHCNSRYCGKS